MVGHGAVGRVRPDSPGARAGIQPGDIVIELSGRPIGSADDLEKIAAQWDGDRPTSVMIRRDGDLQSVILAPAPTAADLLP